MHLETEMKLESMGIGMVSQFPIDPMHLIDLGITKKILLAMINKKTILPMPRFAIMSISEKLCSLSSYNPREFARNPRGLDEISRWKATEFRQFVLYTGLVALRDFVPTEMYEHFLLIHCSYRILLSHFATTTE